MTPSPRGATTSPQIAYAHREPGTPLAKPNYSWSGHGKGHRKADPSAVAHLVPDGGTASGHRSGDPSRRRGLQRDERGRVRAAVLRRSLGARGAADLPVGREAGRRPGRAGDLLARARELPPAGDRVHRPGARRPPHRAAPARRRVRLRRAAATRAPADLLGPPEPAELARAAHGRARDHGLRRRTRTEPAPGQGRDRDLPSQDDRVRLLHDGARRARYAQGRPVPAAVPGRPVLPRRPLARARRDPRVPPVADPRQGRLRDQGRARLPAARRVRPARVREPDRLAVRRSGGHRRGVDRTPDRVADRASLRPLRRDARRW